YYVAAGDAAAAAGDAAAASRAYERALGALEAAIPLDHAAGHRFREAKRASGHAPQAIPDYGHAALYEPLLVTRARLGHWHGVLAAARTLMRLDPWRAGPHVDASVALVNLSRPDDAAVALHAALLLGGEEAGSRLVSVYQSLGEPAAGALVQDGG